MTVIKKCSQVWPIVEIGQWADGPNWPFLGRAEGQGWGKGRHWSEKSESAAVSEGLLPAEGWQSLGQAQLDGGAEHGLCSVPWFGGQFLPCHRGRWELGAFP